MHTLATQRHGSQAPLSARLGLVALVALAEAAHLGWEATHGGIVSHHLLNDPRMPALWNGWGLLVLPAIAWFASARLLEPSARGWRPDRRALLRLACALLAGLALSFAFATGREDAAGAVFLGVALSALVVRAYRGEYLLGFVLGMAFTFGALLPTLIGGVIAAASAAVWFGLWRPLARLRMRSATRSAG